MSTINYRFLSSIRKKHRGKKIVFCSGVFDLTHAGHVLFFEDCKKEGDILVVGVGPDKGLKELKGRPRPIFNEEMRMKIVSSLKPVDYCFLGKPPGRPPVKHFFAPIEDVFKQLRPDIYVVNNDAIDIPFRAKLAQKHEVNIVVLKRKCPPSFENISTTRIIEHIKSGLKKNQETGREA